MGENEKGERLSHIDEAGQARMVNVGQKELIERVAVATAQVNMSPACAEQVAANNIKKGDVLGTAQLAGVTQIFKVGGAQAVAAMAYDQTRAQLAEPDADRTARRLGDPALHHREQQSH